jgi:flagellar biosynthesis protein FlhA
MFANYELQGERGMGDIALPPGEFARLAGALAEKFNTLAETGVQAALVASSRRGGSCAR